MEPKQKQYPAVDGTGDRSKVRCCKEQYCIGTWNVRSMNQGKLEVVKQETARVNVDILGISELKGTGMGEFNSDDHYIYYCGQESLRRNGVAIIVNKRVQKDSSKTLSKHQGVGGGPNSGNFHPLPKNSWNNPPTHQHTKLASLQRLTTPHFKATFTLCSGPHSVCGARFSLNLNKSTTALSLCLSLNSFCNETSRT